MSEPTPVHNRETPKRRGVTLADITSMVRLPGRPATFVTYTADEEGAAREQAEHEGGEYIPLPVPDPVWDWDNHRMSSPTA
ncbi:hypothetical protein [Mycobacteroides abscessus]|uniref:hypothetical protein n=1 Tax=Mycobacteroides abscessus TaxID=36809 RepID=UPI000C258CB8|nr:hypothetical protein [Mycobacteroides abscessus]